MYAYSFENFDPKEGHCAEYFGSQYTDIVDRARKILEDRTREEIIAAAGLIDWITHQDTVERALAELTPMAEALDRGEDDFEGPPFPPAQRLAYYLNMVNLDELEEFPNGSWAEYLAVLALALVADACEEQAYLKEERESEFDRVFWSQMGYFAIEAIEAVTMAECFARSGRLPAPPSIEHATKKRISQQAARAARRRFEPVNRLKQDFINWYRENEGNGAFHSRAQAADIFYRRLPEDTRRLLRPSNAVRTLTDALREALRHRE